MTLGGLNILADQLFCEKPARDMEEPFDHRTMSHQYLWSTVLSAARGHHTCDTPFELLADAALDDRVDNAERLGPYERQILAALLDAPHTVVVITGATGSGKSSTLRSALSFYDSYARLEPSGLASGVDPVHVLVDFNKLEKEFYEKEYERKGTGLHHLYEKIPTRICKALLTSVKKAARAKRVPPAQLVLELAQTAYRWVTEEEEVPHGATFDWPDLLTIGPPVLTGQPQSDLHVLHERLNEQRMKAAGVIFWCAVLDALAIQAIPLKKRAVLLLDNIDPLPDSAQEQIRDLLLTHCLERHFTTVVSLRHSTYRSYRTDGKASSCRPLPRQNNAVEYTWYPHCGPNPVEIVSHRLLGFIADPASYPVFSKLDKEWRTKSVQRALEILLRMTRGTPGYRTLGQMALAGSGDSGRRALQAVRFLFENRNLSFEYSTRQDEVEIARSLGLELKAVACSSRIGLALREELVGFAIECGEVARACDARRWAARLSRALRAVVAGTFKDQALRFDKRVNDIWALSEVQKLCEEDLTTATSLLANRLAEAGLEPGGVPARMRVLADTFVAQLGPYVAPDGQCAPGLTQLIATVAEWLRAPTTSHDDDDRHDDPHGFPLSWDRLRLCSTVLSANRVHAMAHSLVSAGYLHNLFVGSDGKLSIMPLVLLYYLGSAPHGAAPLGDVMSALKAVSSDDEVLATMNRFCHEKGRILWITEDFDHDLKQLEELSRSARVVRLTHGGWAYYHGVLDEVDYVVDTLGIDRAGQHDELLSERVEHSLYRLQALAEVARTQAKSKPLDQPWQAIRQAVVADTAVRATPSLVQALRGHFRKMQGPGSKMPGERRYAECQHTRGVAIKWLEFLVRAKPSLSQRFGERCLAPRDSWSLAPLGRVGGVRSLGPSAGAPELRWTKARDLLLRTLAGDALWRPDFPEDGYR